MITYSSTSNASVWELYGMSTDEKPTTDKIPNGSVFYEMDTKAVFMYDADNKAWLEQ